MFLKVEKKKYFFVIIFCKERKDFCKIKFIIIVTIIKDINFIYLISFLYNKLNNEKNKHCKSIRNKLNLI